MKDDKEKLEGYSKEWCAYEETGVFRPEAIKWLADYPYEEADTQRDWQYDIDAPSPTLLWLAGAICFGAGLATGLGLAWVFG